ncbi:MAG TPA: hypothetical protein VG268_22190 [Streptosporangiaceae bacterium]|nr:hypothetical protein [Streptosporangiaceae bacterium]
MSVRFMRRLVMLAATFVAAAGVIVGVLAGYAQAGRVGAAGPARPAATASQAPGSPSVAPTTAVPSPSVSAPASSPAASPTPSSSSPTPSASSSSPGPSKPFNLVWLWVLLAVIAAVVLIVVITQAGRGRADRTRIWRTRSADAYARGTALTQAVQGASQASQYGDRTAGARWADIQRRADDLTRALQALREIAPTQYDRARVDDVITALDAVRSASQAGDPSAGQRLQARLRNFEDVLQALRGPERT